MGVRSKGEGRVSSAPLVDLSRSSSTRLPAPPPAVPTTAEAPLWGGATMRGPLHRGAGPSLVPPFPPPLSKCIPPPHLHPSPLPLPSVFGEARAEAGLRRRLHQAAARLGGRERVWGRLGVRAHVWSGHVRDQQEGAQHHHVQGEACSLSLFGHACVCGCILLGLLFNSPYTRMLQTPSAIAGHRREQLSLSILFSPFSPPFAPLTCHQGKNLLTKKHIEAETDQLTHVYTLILQPNNTYEVLVDNVQRAEGKLEDDWDFLEPKTIKVGGVRAGGPCLGRGRLPTKGEVCKGGQPIKAIELMYLTRVRCRQHRSGTHSMCAYMCVLRVLT